MVCNFVRKQKAKYTYGVLEKQFRNLFEKAALLKVLPVKCFLQLLEGRLDNVVFRLVLLRHVLLLVSWLVTSTLL